MEISVLSGYAIIVLLAYLLGSIPSGVLVTAFFSGKDIRSKGSGNIGATNVARVAGLRLGLLTLVLDLLKGGVPVYLAGISGIGITDIAMTMASLASVGGHLYPLYSGFKGGGKGVATACGAFLVLAPAACLVAIFLFVLVVRLTRRVSAGSIAAAVSIPVGVWYVTSGVFVFAGACVISFFVVLRHKANVQRLLSGKEPAFFGNRDKTSDQK